MVISDMMALWDSIEHAAFTERDMSSHDTPHSELVGFQTLEEELPRNRISPLVYKDTESVPTMVDFDDLCEFDLSGHTWSADHPNPRISEVLYLPVPMDEIESGSPMLDLGALEGFDLSVDALTNETTPLHPWFSRKECPRNLNCP